MYTINAGVLKLQLNEKGQITAMNDSGDHAYASTSQTTVLIRIVIDGRMEVPSKASLNAVLGLITFEFADSGAVVDVLIAEKSQYATFEIQRIEGADVDGVIWGPYMTTVAGSIGESVGVVHNGQFAIGLQALNIKTVGGWPIELDRLENVQQSYSDNGNVKPDPDSQQISDSKFEYDVCAAWPTSEGSLLQAFARNRSKSFRRPAWNLPLVQTAPISGDDASIVGTSIALFGCELQDVLATIEAIEIREGLPHPMIEGVWGKISPMANQSYLITDFSESTMSEAVSFTKMAGLKYVYHPDPFINWGHFTLKPKSFPNGDEGLKSSVAMAEGEGVHVGVHTLSNFTTLNDSYVTPVPDERLQMAGMSQLVATVDLEADCIEVDDPAPFQLHLFRHTAQIGSEQIEYDGVTESAPWKLTGVKRGVNGTTIATHEIGTIIGRLWDHPYDVFFPNIELQDEYCVRINELFMKTGLKQISFDGLEGCYATGHDGYGVNRFVKMCYDGWGEEVINDASIVVPNYLWHVFTRFNWGEPWGAATREGQLEWRLTNQRYFARNFIPSMLGWFLVRSASDQFEATSPDEIEWVLSKAAGFNAGFALVADMQVLGRNGNIESVFTSVREWETARQAGAFTSEQRERLKDPKSDWHLEASGEGKWNLYPVHISKPLVCNPAELQPGQPGGADWTHFNRYADQPLKFTLRVIPSYGNDDASIKRPTFYTNGVYMTFDTEVFVNQYLVCEGDRIGKVYDQNWKLLRTIHASADAPIVRKGGQPLSFSCKFEGDPKPLVSVRVTTWGEREEVVN
ncbi:hypothetical protein BK120_32005 [Paenibacillus sp. FSL A5-0031]|uniref:hypothetical protein n=1 Tax=Paenibacillus sp. FSL A5-0031 TaxID=1920420 RepID=UPI00096E7B79|nr:hypothetical protein [Paenibacillus sp. FSL A5-0031]OME74100.1 hypothetical protein BK120_32005 [Paenibacillus sp. FSL A5-0031]